MKTLFLTTSTPDTIKLIHSFVSIHPDTRVVQYDQWGLDLVQIAKETNPEFIIYIGAIGKFHNDLPVPIAATLKQIGEVAPSVHICSDAADPPWWPYLEEYHEIGAFKLQVSIDGVHDSPMSRFGMVALTPVDPRFPYVSWKDRIYTCGFAGGGGFRQPMLQQLKSKGLLTWFNEAGYVDYNLFYQFYPYCRLVINDARTGSGARHHVKGRFVEAALAGAIPIETRGAPARNWFTPGVEYLEYGSIDEAEQIIFQATADPTKYEDMAERLRSKMMAEHSGPVFWNRVLTRMNS